MITMDPDEARRTWRTLEPIHTLIYVAQEAAECYSALGLSSSSTGYFASRSAPLGQVPAEVVAGTFFVFEPGLVSESLQDVWRTTTPPKMSAARRKAAAQALIRVLGVMVSTSVEMAKAADLARRVAEAAADDVAGRPLFAAHASLSWPDDPIEVLWHAWTLLREHRGDGHFAVLTAEGVTACEALIMDAATGGPTVTHQRLTRGWSKEAFSTALDRLRERGSLDQESSPTEEGRRFWQQVEARTDQLAAGPYRAIASEGCRQLRELCRPWSRTIVESGAFTVVG